MKLKYKIFITLMVTSILILALTMGVMQFTIRKNFIEFVNGAEFDKQKHLIALLKANYKLTGGWDAIRTSRIIWHEFLVQSHAQFRAEDKKNLPPPPRFRHPQGRNLVPVPNDPGSLHLRLCLFDAKKNYIVGECRQESSFDYRPIRYSGRIIGWLGLENRKEMLAPLEIDFLKKQTQAFYVIGLGVIVILLMVSYAASKYIISPIQALIMGTRAMGKFDFDTRVRVDSSDEFGDLAADFNRMAQTLKQYETMRKNWLSDISHELRTPVGVLLSKIEALQDGIREPTPQLLDSLHKDIFGLGKLINDLHRISIMDSKNLSVDPKRISLISVFDRAMDAFMIRFEQQEIKILKEWQSGDLPDILGDEALLSRVFSNLLENTLKYTNSPGTLKLTCREGKQTVQIEIENSSPNIPDENLEAIFDRLYRVDRSRNKALGSSGLGLNITRKIINIHKGTIKSDHSSLGGVKITIELPQAAQKQF